MSKTAPRVCVLGAGFTGLSAALDLAKQGIDVTLIEKSDRVGGLASGFSINGVSLEKGYHHLFTHDKALLTWLKDLGLPSDTVEWLSGGSGLFMKGILHPFSKPSDILRLPTLKPLQRLRLAVGLAYLRWGADPKQLERFPASRYMRSLLGKTNYTQLFEPLLQAKFHHHKNRVNMAWLWARLDARSRTTRWGKECLGYPKGGFQRIAEEAVRQFSAAGGQLLCNEAVTRIEADGAKWVIQTPERQITADAVLCTLPSHVLAKLFPNPDPQYATKLNATPYLGAVILIIQTPQSLSKYYWHNIHDADSPFVSLLQHTNLVTDGRYGNHIYYMGAYRPHSDAQFSMDETVLTEQYLSYLGRLFPAFDRSQVVSTHLFRLPNAQHAPIGRYRRLIPEFKTPYSGLFLSNFSQIFPQDRGTSMAVGAGRDAAKQIAAYLLS